jgi:hypothetical protein
MNESMTGQKAVQDTSTEVYITSAKKETFGAETYLIFLLERIDKREPVWYGCLIIPWSVYHTN